MISNKVLSGQVCFCTICGTEVSVIKAGSGKLSPVCCDKQMILKESVSPIIAVYAEVK